MSFQQRKKKLENEYTMVLKNSVNDDYLFLLAIEQHLNSNLKENNQVKKLSRKSFHIWSQDWYIRIYRADMEIKNLNLKSSSSFIFFFW